MRTNWADEVTFLVIMIVMAVLVWKFNTPHPPRRLPVDLQGVVSGR